MLITVLHESVYTDVCIMNEVELLIQICGLHKESKGRRKRSPVEYLFMACLVKLMAAVLIPSPSCAVTGGIITWGNQHLCKV